MTTNPASAVELLPCPVCGDRPKWRGSQSDYRVGIYRLQCIGETHLFQAYGPSEQKCSANWNTRAQPTPASDDHEGLVERLRERARAVSNVSRMMSEAKSLRNSYGARKDIYSWEAPEQTLEWQAAVVIAALSTPKPATSEVERLRSALGMVRLIVEDEAYKVVANQAICKHIAALNEIHETATAALAGKDVS